MTFLGTSAASLSPASSTSAYLIEVNQKHILIDAGIGALRQIRKLKVDPEDIDLVLITHWHIDHFAGLPALLRARPKSAPLLIYGPTIPLYVQPYLALLSGRPGMRFEAISAGFSRSYPDFDMRAIANSHAVKSYGWEVSEKAGEKPDMARRVVFSGDTRPAKTVLDSALGADLLVHEATYLDKHAGAAIVHQHSTAREAAEIALESCVGALALTHTPSRYSRLEIQAEAQRIFPQVFVPAPLDTIQLEPPLSEDAKEQPGWARIRLTPPLPTSR